MKVAFSTIVDQLHGCLLIWAAATWVPSRCVSGDRGVADDLNEFTGGSLDQRLNLRASFFLVSAGKSNLDELMTINGDVQFGDQIRRDAFLSEHDDGAQGMGKTAQIALLERGEWHE